MQKNSIFAHLSNLFYNEKFKIVLCINHNRFDAHFQFM